MKKQSVPSSPNKKGLSLSLSKKKDLSISIQNTPKRLSQESQTWNLRNTLPPQRPVHLFHSNTIVNIQTPMRSPVIIYRYQKSEWEKLQEANKLKRQEVNRMKQQLQALNKQLILTAKTIPQIKSVPCSPANTSVIAMIDNFQQPSKLEGPLSEKKSQPINQINYISPNTQPEQKYMISDENRKPIAKNETGMDGEKKFNFRTKRPNIDMESLVEIENRLNKLIDFTNF